MCTVTLPSILCDSKWDKACKNIFSLMVNKKRPLCQVGACQHTSVDDVGLSMVLSSSVQSGSAHTYTHTHTRTHTHTYKNLHGRPCACASWIRSQHWNAITWQRGTGCFKWVRATRHLLVFYHETLAHWAQLRVLTEEFSRQQQAWKPASLDRVHVLCL